MLRPVEVGSAAGEGWSPQSRASLVHHLIVGQRLDLAAVDRLRPPLGLLDPGLGHLLAE
jgi:hypothetical protein